MNFNYENFIMEMMKYASSGDSPDRIINQLMQYICERLQSDRAYIFEDNGNGTFRNSYEFCRPGVTPEKDNLQEVPFEGVLDVWFKEYDKSHNILIRDVEEYRKVSEPIYDYLKPQGINTIVTGPLEIDGKYVGLYGVDNPPVEIMEHISNLIEMMEFIVCMMLKLRNYSDAFMKSSLTDSLTGLWNRKALNWAYENMFENADSIAVLMCDLNGLKRKNDTEGHRAGDKYIVDTSEALIECFGQENVYRLGGDEFVVIRLSEERFVMEESISRFRKLCRKKEVSISLGFEYRSPINESFERILHEADKKMYRSKKKYYETNGLDRRSKMQYSKKRSKIM